MFTETYSFFRSPDFNALDLGAWYSLSAGVPSLRMQRQGRLIDSIINHVLNWWKEWDAMGRLENIYFMKSKIMEIVFKEKGSNEYEIPRTTHSHKNDGPTYLPKLTENAESESEVEEEPQVGLREEEEVSLNPLRSLSRIFEDIANQNEVTEYWLESE